MDGIVSLLDDQHRDEIDSLWVELEREFGLRGIFATRFPHFSYHLAESFDAERLSPILTRFAQGHAPFLARATGLGIFTGPQPVLFIPIVRTPELTRLHQELWWAVAGTTVGTSDLYHPHTWVPHITLAHGGVDQAKLGCAVSQLAFQIFQWEFQVDHLAVGYAASTDMSKLIKRFPFQG